MVEIGGRVHSVDLGCGEAAPGRGSMDLRHGGTAPGRDGVAPGCGGATPLGARCGPSVRQFCP